MGEGWLIEGRLLIGLFLLCTFIVFSALAHSLEGILIGARDQLRDALRFLNVHVSLVHLNLGDKIADGVTDAFNPVISAMGRAAHASDAQVAKYFYGMERVAKEVFDAIEATSMIVVTLAYWAGKEIYHGAIGGKINNIKALQIAQNDWLRHQSAVDRGMAGDIAATRTHVIPNVVDARIGPLQAEVNALRSAIAQEIPLTQELLREQAQRLSKVYHDLYHRIRKYGLELTGIGAASVAAVAIERLGISWVRCSRWKQIGKMVCGPGGGFVQELLSLLTDVLILANICQVIPLLEEGASLVAAPLIEGLTVVGAGICDSSIGPPPTLNVPQLYLPASPGIGTLHLV